MQARKCAKAYGFIWTIARPIVYRFFAFMPDGTKLTQAQSPSDMRCLEISDPQQICAVSNNQQKLAVVDVRCERNSICSEQTNRPSESVNTYNHTLKPLRKTAQRRKRGTRLAFGEGQCHLAILSGRERSTDPRGISLFHPRVRRLTRPLMERKGTAIGKEKLSVRLLAKRGKTFHKMRALGRNVQALKRSATRPGKAHPNVR